MQKKNLIIALAIVGVAVAVFSAGNIYAQTEPGGGKSIVERIAERFNLKPEDVQGVFDQQKADMVQARQKNLEDKLTALVTAGKLTEDQKTKLLAKLNERKSNMADFKNLTKDQIKTKMDQERTDFDAWLKENNIDMKALGLDMGMGFGGKGGPMTGGHKGPWHKK